MYEFIFIFISEIFFKAPPFFPVKDTISALCFFASIAALTKLLDLPGPFITPPLVDKIITKSSFLTYAWTDLLKKSSNLKSLLHAVIAALCVVRGIIE